MSMTKDKKKLINGLEKIIDGVPEKAYTFFVGETPVRSGNARRNTRLRKETIKADYAYAGRLDDGWSRQAPDGMVDPTIDYVDRLISEKLRRF